MEESERLMPEQAESVEDLWRELIEKDDRTSPEEYPDMALISFAEFSELVRRAGGRSNASSDVAGVFDRADWFWRTLDPDDAGDNPEEAINRGMLGTFCVAEIACSFSGPTRYGFLAELPDSDEQEFRHFATQEEAVEACKAAHALVHEAA